MLVKPIFGSVLEKKVALEIDSPVAYFENRDDRNSYFYVNSELLSTHFLLLGGAGSGKTNVFDLFLEQLRDQDEDRSNDIMIVFDTKGDYYKSFFRPGDYVIGNGTAYRDTSRRWNIFDDILADGYAPENYEINAREMAEILFEGRGSTSQPFFCSAAKNIFAYVMIYFIRRAQEDPFGFGKKLNNKSLVEFLQGAGGEELHKIFDQYSDMKGLNSYIGRGDSNQALGVLGELKGMLYDCFLGVFADEDRDRNMSIRECVRRKGGRAIFIEYDMTVGETMTPIYRLLVDLALKEALGRKEGEKGNVYLILDELKLLPKLKHLDDALNFGRSMGVKVIAGLQSVNQMYDIYGRERGTVIVGGFGSVLGFRCSDDASRQYLSELFGKNLVAYQYQGLDNSQEKREREGHTVESWELMKLKKGQAVVGLSGHSPFLFQFQKYEGDEYV